MDRIGNQPGTKVGAVRFLQRCYVAPRGVIDESNIVPLCIVDRFVEWVFYAC